MMKIELEGLTKEEELQLNAMCCNDLGLFSKAYLEDAFYAPFSSLHYEIIKAIDGPWRKVAIAAPRGLGKTSLARSAVIRAISYMQQEFICYISNSATNAEMQTENIKREMKSNPKLRHLFGNIELDRENEELDETFSKTAWVAFGRTLVLPRGAHQQVRGLIYKNVRPQLIIVDDLEKKDELENPDNRTKLKSWFYSDLEKCVNRYKNDWKIVYIDTLKHYDSLLQELLDSPDWYSLRLDLCDDNYNSNVPELISTAEIKREVEIHRARGQLDVFYMEFRNLPVAKETASFDAEHFQYYNETDKEFQDQLSQLENVVIVDPAKTANMSSADSAIVGVGVNYQTNAIYFRECVRGKMYPDEVYEQMFAMKRRLNAHAVGIEVTGLEEFIKQPILNEMSRRGPIDFFEPIWLKARGGPADGEKGKIKRIASLVPYYRLGYIYHNKNCSGPLEAQLIPFPRSALLDVADAFAYIIEMLELGERYFTSPPDPEDHDPEAEFRDLEDEYEPALDDWRLV
jgi:hypothetical protein